MVLPQFVRRWHWTAQLARGLVAVVVALVVVPARWVTSSWARSIASAAGAVLIFVITLYEHQATVLKLAPALKALLPYAP